MRQVQDGRLEEVLVELPLPPVAPPIGLNQRVRLGRDYYVRVDTVDYSVDPRAIGRFVDVTASLTEVAVFCEGQLVARHERCWAKQAVITIPTTRPPRPCCARTSRRNEHAARPPGRPAVTPTDTSSP